MYKANKKLLGDPCIVPFGIERQRNLNNNLFLQKLIEEEGRVKKLHAKEILLTKENPRIRDQYEINELSESLRAVKHEANVNHRIHAQMRNNIEELRELAIGIRRARCTKGLVDQMQENQAIKDAQLAEKKRYNAKLQKERNVESSEGIELEEKERARKAKYRAELFQQMAEANLRKHANKNQQQREREEMLQDVNQMKAEKAAELQKSRERKVSMKNEMTNFARAQQAYKAQLKEVELYQDLQHKEFQNQRDEAKRVADEKKQSEFEQKEAVKEMVGKALFKIKSEKQKKEDMLLDLLVEERIVKEEIQDRQRAEQAVEARLKARIEAKHYLYEAQLHKKLRQIEDDEYTRKVQAEYEADVVKRDREMEELRKKKAAYLKKLQECDIDARREDREMRIQNELHDNAILKERAENFQQRINRERMRMLRRESRDVVLLMPSTLFKEDERKVLNLPAGYK